MDTEKILAALMKAAGLDPKKAKLADLHGAIDAYAALGLALNGKSEEEKAGEEPKPEEKKEEEKPAEAAVPPPLSAVPALSNEAPAVTLSAETVIPTPAPEVALDANGATSLAESPEAQAAAAKQIFDKLSAACGLDAAALLAAVSDNAEAIAALLGKQPESGQPSDKPAEAAPAMAASAVPASVVAELEATKAVLSKYKADADKANALLAAREAQEKQADAERAADAVIKAGKALDTARPHLVTLARDNRGAFDSLVASMPQVVPTGEHSKDVPPSKSTQLELNATQRQMFNTQIASGNSREHALKRALEMKPSV